MWALVTELDLKVREELKVLFRRMKMYNSIVTADRLTEQPLGRGLKGMGMPPFTCSLDGAW